MPGQNIKMIIGASYGDEGKGLATDFFGAAAGGNTVNVLTNGGPQRGHTVEMPDGRRHVFRHFGAASFRGAETYFAGQFIINPMEFMKEYEEIDGLGMKPVSYTDPQCRFTTPWDMLVNQAVRNRDGVHNTCGYGIWETVTRYDAGSGIGFGHFMNMDRDARIRHLRRIRDGWCTARFRQEGLTPPDIFYSDGLLRHFEEDCGTMQALSPIVPDVLLRRYGTVLFENAQGLMLDGNTEDGVEFTTPSTTGAGKIFLMTERLFSGADIETCYVTRSYLTRHGDGPMENEIGDIKEALPGLYEDVTNKENPFQGGLRYGLLDEDALARRIRSDFSRRPASAKNRYSMSVMVTHMNENRRIDMGTVSGEAGRVYASDGKTAKDVHILKT